MKEKKKRSREEGIKKVLDGFWSCLPIHRGNEYSRRSLNLKLADKRNKI